jgi:hypothetical protein
MERGHYRTEGRVMLEADRVACIDFESGGFMAGGGEVAIDVATEVQGVGVEGGTCDDDGFGATRMGADEAAGGVYIVVVEKTTEII